MRARWNASRALLPFFASILLSACATQKAEVKVMSSGGFTAAYKELTPEFERKTKHTVVTSYGASMGGAPDSIPSRIARGEPVDVVILAEDGLNNLIKQGKVEPDSRVDLARSSIGMAVRAGAPKPDISTVGALKRTLLDAKSIAYSASASGTYLSTVLFKQLGVYDQVKDKAKRIESERVGTVVARGDAEIGFQQVSELLPIAGIDYVGPIPAELQQYAVFSAGIAVEAKEAAAGRELVQFLCSPGSAPTIKKTGLDPITCATQK
jgi:molybdate transport system substrate-binding protein